MRIGWLVLAGAVLGGWLGWRLRPSGRALGLAIVSLVYLEIFAFIAALVFYKDEFCEEDPQCELVALPAFVVLFYVGPPLLVAAVAALVAKTFASRFASRS